jgi:hypothetical protein
MNSRYRLLALAVALAACACAAFAADLPPDVLVRSRWTELTRADYDAALAKVPANSRWEFATSPKRVQDLLNNLLLTKTLAAQARVHGTRADLAGGSAVGIDAERALANAELKRIEADASRSFDTNKDVYQMKARELYALDKAKYQKPEEVRISDIAVAIKDRGEDAALARAREARQRLVAGADFAAVAREYSDDATTREKGGALPFVTAKALAPDYARSVFALTKVGEISEPIKAPSAYHVVRLEERRPSRVQPFEDVQDAIMSDLRQRYVKEQRDARIRSIHTDPGLLINQPAIDALVNRIDPKLFKPQPQAKPPEPGLK